MPVEGFSKTSLANAPNSEALPLDMSLARKLREYLQTGVRKDLYVIRRVNTAYLDELLAILQRAHRSVDDWRACKLLPGKIGVHPGTTIVKS